MIKIMTILTVIFLTQACSSPEKTQENKEAANQQINITQKSDDRANINSYCWITDGNTRFYEMPNETSPILWYFTVGDQIQILDLKYDKNETWYKVAFNGDIKAGYDGLRAMGGKPNQHIGWIIKRDTQLFKCN